VGGLNLFGRSFGNYPQDLSLRLEYLPGQAHGAHVKGGEVQLVRHNP
jgi:hypothetical protein